MRESITAMKTCAWSPNPCNNPTRRYALAPTSAETFALVGRLGYPIFINPSRVSSLLDLAPLIREYKRARWDAGYEEEAEIGLRLPVYVAETAEKAYSEPRESTLYQIQRLINVITASASQGGIQDDRLAQAERLKTLDYDGVLDNMVVYGIPDAVSDRLAQLREELGFNQMVYEVNFGCRVPLELQINCVRLLTEQVAPQFK